MALRSAPSSQADARDAVSQCTIFSKIRSTSFHIPPEVAGWRQYLKSESDRRFKGELLRLLLPSRACLQPSFVEIHDTQSTLWVVPNWSLKRGCCAFTRQQLAMIRSLAVDGKGVVQESGLGINGVTAGFGYLLRSCRSESGLCDHARSNICRPSRY